jgi:hypothetical protein
MAFFLPQAQYHNRNSHFRSGSKPEELTLNTSSAIRSKADTRDGADMPHHHDTPDVVVPFGGSSLRMVSRIGGPQSWVCW